MYSQKAVRWAQELEAAEALATEIRGILGERDEHPRTSVLFSKMSNSARQGMKQLETAMRKLEQELPEVSSSLTLSEFERRQRSLENLRSKERQLWEVFHDPSKRQLEAQQRRELFSDGPTIGWEGETEQTRNYTEDDIRAMRRDVIQRQDEGLEILAASIARQKNMAGAINQEVDAHNELIDDIFDGMDHTRERLLQETQSVKVVAKKTRTFAYWVVIIMLLIAIIVVAVV